MNLKFEFDNERKKYLGLDECNTEKVYKTLIDYYKQKLLKAPRNIIGYSIDIVICNMNYYNKLGKLENLNKTWGDRNFYVDINNSALVEMIINKDGNMESSFTDMPFSKIKEFKDIDNISFSLKELIELCQKDNFNIKIYAKDSYDDQTTVEIESYMPFDMNESIEKYLETVK